jgi:hypothetical protein
MSQATTGSVPFEAAPCRRVSLNLRSPRLQGLVAEATSVCPGPLHRPGAASCGCAQTSPVPPPVYVLTVRPATCSECFHPVSAPPFGRREPDEAVARTNPDVRPRFLPTSSNREPMRKRDVGQCCTAACHGANQRVSPSHGEIRRPSVEFLRSLFSLVALPSRHASESGWLALLFK